MKVAVLSESSAEEEFLLTIAGAALRRPLQHHPVPLRSRGWPSVLNICSEIIKALHLNTDVDGLLIFADSDHSPLPMEGPHVDRSTTRLEQLRGEVNQTLAELPSRTSGARLRVAVGVAVPVIEAWALAARHDRATSAAFLAYLSARPRPNPGQIKRDWKDGLKRDLYKRKARMGRMTDVLKVEGLRLAATIETLRMAFPYGLARCLMTWVVGKDRIILCI